MSNSYRHLICVVLAPFASCVIGALLFLVGMGVSHLNDPMGEFIAIVGGIYVAPIFYGVIAFLRMRSAWIGLASAVIGFLGTWGLAYLLWGPGTHH